MKVLVACEESQRVCMSFRELGHEAYSCDLIDPSGNHTEWHVKGDCIPLLRGGQIVTMDGVMHEIDKWDLIIGHPPCFVAGTMIMTENGVKPIEDIQIGDMVLTHKGRYKPVLDTMSKSVAQIVDVHAENCGHIKCTANHPFYTTHIQRIWDKNSKKYFKQIGKFEWKSPNNFTTIKFQNSAFKEATGVVSVSDTIKQQPSYNGCYIKKNAFSEKYANTLQVSSPHFWYFVGRWLGDGWHCHKNKGRIHGYYGVIICCALDETKINQLRQAIELAGFKYWESKTRTGYRFEIDNKELSNYMLQFGDKAYGKHLIKDVFHLPDDLAIALINGYFDSDGHITQSGVCSFSTISKNLAYDMKYMINKYYKVACSIAKRDNSRGSVIEGRKCNVHPIYIGTFRKEFRSQSHYINKDNYIIANYKSVKIIETNTTVYNLSVLDDESYTANGLVVHNCTFLTCTGNRWFNVERYGEKAIQRIKDREDAARFFMQIANADCEHIAIENPVGYMSTYWRKPDQIIQPYQFGHEAEKKTCLWLKGLPKLVPTNEVNPPERVKFASGKTMPKWYADAWHLPKEERSKLRSQTFWGIAKAMAEQWSKYIEENI